MRHLADVDQIRGALADDVHAQQPAAAGIGHQLEQAVLDVRDLAARDFVEAGAADHRRAPLRGARPRPRPGPRRPSRECCRCPPGWSREVPTGGRPSAWRAARRPCSMAVAASAGRADHVAHRVDVRHRGAAVLVDLQQAARGGLEACVFDLQAIEVGRTSQRDQHLVALDALAVAQPGDHLRDPVELHLGDHGVADEAAAACAANAPRKRSTSSASMNLSGRSTRSIMVTLTPRAAKIDGVLGRDHARRQARSTTPAGRSSTGSNRCRGCSRGRPGSRADCAAASQWPRW